MTRTSQDIEEITYTLTPEEVTSAIKNFIHNTIAVGSNTTGVVGPYSWVTLNEDGSAACTSRYVNTPVKPKD